MKCVIFQTPMPGQWTEYPEYPFCTKRCKMIDLGRWLDEGYRVSTPDDANRSTRPDPDGPTGPADRSTSG